MKVVAVKKAPKDKAPGDGRQFGQPLYEIAEEYRQAAETLAEADLPEAVINDTLEGMAGALTDKVANICALILNYEAEATVVAEAGKRMAARAKALNGRADHLRDYVLRNMEHATIAEVKTPQFVAKIAINPVSIEITDFDALSRSNPQYIVTKTEFVPDKKLIREAIDAGLDVPGAVAVRSHRLTIK